MRYISVAIIAFWAGFYVNGLRHEKQFQEYISASFEKQAQDIQAARNKEQEYREKVGKTTRQAKEAIDVVNAHYRKLLNDSLSKSSASSNNSVPAASTPSATVSKSSCKCPNQNREKLQRLYEQQLIIARDCDITATHYNELIELFNELNK